MTERGDKQNVERSAVKEGEMTDERDGGPAKHIAVLEIVCDWLQAHGYDGLWTDFGDGSEFCGCGVEYLAPCDEACPGGCVAARRGPDNMFYPVEHEAGTRRDDEQAEGRRQVEHSEA